ncbi:MAG: hypothetical protein P0S95_06510 [Rhabdochlamydiaceae bacterium]|nr:hypothetical protein [Candidatus Amphrikana amoebophyrae]
MSKDRVEELYDLKPIIYKIRDYISLGKQNPKYLVEMGVTYLYGYLVALEGVASYFDEQFREVLSEMMGKLEQINANYIESKDPTMYVPMSYEIDALEKWVNSLCEKEYMIKRADFAYSFVSTLQYVEEKIEMGSPSLDDVYSLYGLVSALDLVEYCRQIDQFRVLVHNFEAYSSSWPAKFALHELQESLRLLLKGQRKLAA